MAVKAIYRSYINGSYPILASILTNNAITMLGGEIAAIQSDGSIGISDGTSAFGLIVDSKGDVIQSGKVTVDFGPGDYVTDRYDGTANWTAAVPGSDLYVSSTGLLTLTGTVKVGSLIKAPTSGDPLLRFKLTI